MNTNGRSTVAVVIGVSIICLTFPPLRAQEGTKTWSNVMYLGGAAGVRGKSLNWDNTLAISPQTITFSSKGALRFEIATSSVRSLDYSGHRHVNDGAVAAGAAAGLLGMLVGSTMKSTDYYVIVWYTLPDGTDSAVLLRLHKNNQQEIIGALRAVTKLRADQ